jgi:hypothetical protein
VSDPDSSRPRLVSVGEDYEEKPAEAPAAEASDSASGPMPRRVLWLLVVLSIAVMVGLVAQTLRARALQQANEVLTGELFATRSALDAYVARFAEVRESIDGLQTQLEQLDALVSADPLAPPPGSELETEPAAELSD